MSVPVVAVSPTALADLLLAADGLLAHPAPLGGPVPDPDPTGPVDRHVLVPLADADADAAAAAGTVLVRDDEAVPVVTLSGVVRAPEGVRGAPAPGPGASRAAGHERRGRPPVAAARTAVVLERPLDPAEEAEVAAEVAAGRQVVLVVPVAGPSPDGLAVTTLLALADGAAERTGAVVLGVPLARRSPADDARLAAHVATALRARLRTAAADEPGWRALVEAHRAGRGDGDAAARAAPGVHAALAARFPPPHRRGLVVLLTGLSGSGKSTIARHLVDRLEALGRRCSLLDGDHVRAMLSAGLGFSREDRERNVLRIGYVAAQVARHGGVAVCAPIAPYASTRAQVRRMVEEAGGDLVLVHVSTPLAECERRDVKGLYARARSGEVPLFTGISDPYEEPVDADLAVDTTDLAEGEAVDRVVDLLRAGGRLAAGA